MCHTACKNPPLGTRHKKWGVLCEWHWSACCTANIITHMGLYQRKRARPPIHTKVVMTPKRAVAYGNRVCCDCPCLCKPMPLALLVEVLPADALRRRWGDCGRGWHTHEQRRALCGGCSCSTHYCWPWGR